MNYCAIKVLPDIKIFYYYSETTFIYCFRVANGDATNLDIYSFTMFANPLRNSRVYAKKNIMMYPMNGMTKGSSM